MDEFPGLIFKGNLCYRNASPISFSREHDGSPVSVGIGRYFPGSPGSGNYR